MTQAVADTLRRARALIDTPDKWCQGTVLDAHGRRCASGAIESASTFPLVINVRRALEFIIGYPADMWNDMPDRTHAEVMTAFDAAIAAEEREP